MKANLIIAICFLCSLWLDILPMPYWLDWVRPDFTLLILIYWSLAMPERCGIFAAMLLGLLVDILIAAPLGQHVLAYTVVTSFIALTFKRVRIFDVWQQAGLIFLLIGIAQLIEHWLDLLAGRETIGLWFLLPTLISAFVWPWLMLVMRSFRRRMGLVKQLI